MKKSLPFITLAAAALFVSGCAKDYFVTHRFASDRAELGQDPIAVPPPAPIVNADPSGPSLPGVLEPTIRGTWTFVTPTTTTRINHVTDTYAQYSLYYGRPDPTDKPFVVITTGDSGAALNLDADAKTLSERDYVLNDNIAHERVGRLADGAAFCDLVIHRPADPSDTCHATAIARTEDQRKLALQILASITWSANK